MNRAAGAVRIQARQVERFRDNTFARKRGVSVNRHRNHRRLVAFGGDAWHALQRTGDTFHDGIDDLQMRRIWHKTQAHIASIHRAGAVVTEVILHIAGSVVIAVIVSPFEFREECFERLAHHVGEHVQPATMRHTDDNLARASTP